jgi:hypothetical protein
MTGVVVGGWEYVIAAYAVTAVAFVIYGVTLVTRLREERSRALTRGETE